MFDVVLVWFLAPLVRDGLGDKFKEWWDAFLKKWAGIFKVVLDFFKKWIFKCIVDFFHGLAVTVAEWWGSVVETYIVDPINDLADWLYTKFSNPGLGSVLMTALMAFILVLVLYEILKPKR